MAQQRDDIYIKLPGPKGGNDVHVPVDIARLSRGFFRQLYTRVSERSGSVKYQAVHGYEHLLDAPPDMREVLTALDERLDETLNVLGEADVDLIIEMKDAFAKLAALVTAVNLGNQDGAVHIVNELGWLIMSGTAKAVEMHRAAVEAKAQAFSTYTAVAEVHEVREELDDMALTHADNADKLSKSFDKLRAALDALREKRTELFDAFQSARAAYSEAAEPWASAWAFLGEGEDCFTMRVFDYERMDDELDDEARADIEKARRHLTTCDLRIAALQAEQRSSHSHQAVLTLVETALSAGAHYQQTNIAFRQHLERVGDSVVTRGLVTRAEYERATKLHDRYISELDVHTQSIRSLEHECDAYLDAKKLTLTERLTRTLDETRAFLDSIEVQEPRPSKSPARPSTPPPVPQSTPSTTPPDDGDSNDEDEEGDTDDASSAQPAKAGSKPVSLPGDDKLAEKLYELMICVGAFRKDAPHAGSFKSLYRCVAELGIIPREDAHRAYRLVQDLSHRSGERRRIERTSFTAPEQRQMAQRTTDATWLSWRMKYPCLRLTRAGQERANELMRKYTLTNDDLTRAWKVMRERVVQEREAHRARKKAKTDAEAPAPAPTP